MSAPTAGAKGLDFSVGVPISAIADGATLAGHSAGHPILVSRFGEAFFAVSGVCTHYGAPLGEGLCRDGAVRCPWHHARFDLRSGAALAAPAFDALERWRVEIEGELMFARDRLPSTPAPEARRSGQWPKRIIIVGGGAAGFAAAEMLRRRGFDGEVTMLSAEASAPCDRPNVSKDYLAGTAALEWMPLKPEAFYREHKIDLRCGVEVQAIDLSARCVRFGSGQSLAFDTLLLATGAEPIRLPAPGFALPNVFTLRSMADADAIIAAATRSRRVAVIGASFIGLEAAAALRTRGLEVEVVAPDDLPMKRLLGGELGGFIKRLHEQRGVKFHLGQTAQSFDGRSLALSDGSEIKADFVVLGVGVRPRLALAEAAGLKVDGGVVVDAFLQTSAAGVFAAGDIAKFPRGSEHVRIEHWAVAERQGQVAACNMLGEQLAYRAVPFFWSHHYDVSLRYVGYAKSWDALQLDGSLASGSATIRYLQEARMVAAATLGRDRNCLEIEAALEAEYAI